MWTLPVFLFLAWVLAHKYGAAPLLLAAAAVLLVFCGFYYEGDYMTRWWAPAVAFGFMFAALLAVIAAFITAAGARYDQRQREGRP